MEIVPAMPSHGVYPEQLWIATQKAYTQQWPFPYVLFDGINVCNTQTTQNGQLGEILAILPADSATGSWFVAFEGKMVGSQFVPRQACFRTKEQFWEAGWHNWETNQKVCKDDQAPDPEWDAEWSLNCQTKHRL